MLAGWTGWGALPHVLDPQSSQHSASDFAQVQQLLSREELEAARLSTLNAHYTDPAYASAVWDAVGRLGFQEGRVLEAGCGSGNFLGAAPAGARFVGVELDPTTAAIAQARYPDADIRAESFAETRLPEQSVDLVVGNVPFGRVALHDKRHNAGRHSIHNHFLIKGIHLLKPGGLMAVITSRYTLDAQNPAARRELEAAGDLLGAVRLPSGAHRGAAGTDVVTDLLVFRRRQDGASSRSEAFERSAQHGAGVAVNEYFHRHPEHVLGEMTLGKAEGGRPELIVREQGDVGEQLGAALKQIVSHALQAGQRFEPQAPEFDQQTPVAQVGQSKQPYGYLAVEGDDFTVVADLGAVPLSVPRTQRPELRALLGLRDTAVALLEAEAGTNDDTPKIDQLRAELNRRYDGYTSQFGPINRFSYRRTGRTDPKTGEAKLAKVRPRQGGFRKDPFANVVYALEHFSESDQVARKATIFEERAGALVCLWTKQVR